MKTATPRLIIAFLSAGALFAAEPAGLVNISTRVAVGGSAGTPIPGFVLSGVGTKSILVRAVGPTLAGFGVSGVMADPRLSLVRGTAIVADNDNWLAADAPVMASVGAFAMAAGSKDAAVLASLSPGAYTAPVTAVDSGTGVALVEVYSASGSSAATVVNASTRAHVGTGDNVLIPGFVIGGAGSLRLLIRAVGPTLAGFGVGDALADPMITLYRGTTALAANDNWSSAINAGAVSSTAAAVGAFALANGSRDAAILASLEPGTYSAIISGVGGTTGTALVELYVVPPATAPPAVGAWGWRAELLEANSEMSVAELDGKIYVIGGYPSTRLSVATVQVYDPATDIWRLTTPLPVALNHTVSAGVGGKLYVIGGQTTAGGTGPFVNTVYEYDPVRATWATRAPMPTARGGGGGAVIEGKIYVVGGRPPHGSEFAVYDPATNTWKILPDLPTQRNHIGVAAIDGKIYVVGGRFEAGFESEKTDRVEVFDPLTGQWSTRAPLPRPRGGVNAIAAHGYLHVFGGEGNDEVPSGVFPDHDVYHPATNTWTRLAPMPVPVHGVTGAAFLNGVIHLTGGGISLGGASGSTIHQIYRPATNYP